MNRRTLLYLLVTVGALALLVGFGLSATRAATPAQTGSPPSTNKQDSKANAPVAQQAPGKVGINLHTPAAPNVVLYDQYDNDFNNGIVSADRVDNSALSAQAADDFVVPAGQVWTVNEVDIRSPTGFGSPTAFGVYFYSNSGGLPATPVYSATNLAVTGNPDYVITLTSPAVLPPGTYWVSAQGTMNGSNWYWEGRNVTSNSPVAWREGGGYGTSCVNTWGVLASCIGQAWPDQMFRIVGNSAAQGTPTPTVTGTPPTATRTATATATACVVNYAIATTTGATVVPGTNDIGNHTDDGATLVNLPFSYTLYDQTYTAVNVSSNGTASFTSTSASFSNQCLPSTTYSTYTIFPFWDDQYTVDSASGQGIFTSTTGTVPNRIFNIEWRTQYCCSSGPPVNDYELRLYEGQTRFDVIYGTPMSDRSSATIGVQKDNTAYTPYVCNTAGPTSGTMLTFTLGSCAAGTSTATATAPAASPTRTATAPAASATPTCGAGGGTPGPWTTATPYPITDVRYGFAEVGNSFYVIGGVSNGTRVANVYRYDVGPGTWTALANIPVASEAPTCAYNSGANKIYCAEGDTGSSFQIYNIATNTWSAGPNVPGAANRYGAASGSFGNLVYVIGGSTSIQSDVQIYNIGTNTWSTGTPAANTMLLPGYQPVGQYLYIVGGFTASPSTGAAGGTRSSGADSSVLGGNKRAVPDANNTTTLRLDMSTGTWSSGPAWTPARADFGLAYYNNKLFALGGDATGGGYFDSTNLVNELDVSAWPGGSWVASPPLLPTPNRQANQAGFTSSDGRIWSVGGIDGSTFTFLADNLNRQQPVSVPCGTATITPTTGPSSTPTRTAVVTPSATATCGTGGTPGPWVVRSPVPYAARGPFTVSDGTYLYVGGGYDGTNIHSDLLRYNPATDAWATLTPSPDQHFLGPAVYVSTGNKIYNPGGFGPGSALTNIMRIYDVAGNSWSTGANMPATLSDHAVMYWNGVVYVAGGYNGSGATNTVFAYNIAGNSWTTLAPLPQALYLPGFGAINGKLYVAGGNTGSVDLDTLYIYDIATNTWTTGPNMPRVATGPGSTVLNGKLWVFGGASPFPTTVTTTNIYDPATNTWSTGPSMNVARMWLYGAAVGNTIVAPGGDTNPGIPINANESSTTSPGVPCGSVTSTPSPTRTTVPTATGTTVPSVTRTTAPSATSTTAPSATLTSGPGPSVTPGLPTDTPTEEATSTSTPSSPTVTETPCTINFSDVHPTDYFYEPVRYLYCHGVISGYGDGTFRPYADTTRGQMVKIVILGFGIAVTTPAGGAYTFHDVPPGAPFFDVIETAALHNIISGYNCGPGGPGPCDPQNRPYFLPNNSVTRGQLSKIDVIGAGWPQINPSTPTFTDVPPANPFYSVIETAVCHGVVSGYADHTFHPFANATRGQISKIVYLSIVTPFGACTITPVAR